MTDPAVTRRCMVAKKKSGRYADELRSRGGTGAKSNQGYAPASVARGYGAPMVTDMAEALETFRRYEV